MNGKRKEVVIAYGSEHLSETQKRWSTLEKELYGIIYALDNFYPYLYGGHFTVYTDHQPLVSLLKNPVKDETAKVTRWILRTQSYDMTVVYRPGPLNANADGLSRIPEPTKTYQPPNETTAPICLILEDLTTEQAKDSYCTTARTKFEAYTVKEGTQRARKNLEPSKKKKPPVKDPEESDSEDEQEYLRLGNGLMATFEGKILAPESLRGRILFRYHDDPLAGHLRIKKTRARIRSRYYWPNMNKEIKRYVL